MLLTSTYALLAVLAGQAFAGDIVKCYTSMTNKKPQGYVPTKTETHYTPCTTKQTKPVYTTKTPKYTTTRTEYTTTYVTEPNKYTSTVVVTVTTSTKKATDTKTSTSTSTSTKSVTSTVTERAPANFTPIQSSLPNSSNSGAAGGAPRRKRSETQLTKRASNKGYGKSYPKKVTCHKYTKDKNCATKYVTTTKTVYAHPKTYTEKTTKTQTQTKCPKAKKTTTSTKKVDKTITVGTTTTTVTTTTTSSTTVATTTVNAACRLRTNYADKVSGIDIVEAIEDPFGRAGVNLFQFQVQDAFECCNEAFSPRTEAEDITAPEVWAFDRRRNPNNREEIIGFCTLLGTETCGAGQANGRWQLLNEEQACGPVDQLNVVAGPLFGNAPCGLGIGSSGQCPPPQPEE
ncbi:hypothetical protein CB0940_05282 [Cercospora beticola]|uniref:Uncharacterized protein n=1 Tax=Cercospora beticola TaxID=122368 RepID=A0A2G5HKZ3_CERBT|nr:hypothetical protein CB0940_05282 [Cercospora beticola]PIA92882.1 hypothetical protein CB0940_05282 [Cercospora beticola]WPB02602.1 hypothetical protein RHO25_007238 [Cercospora beticola]CAK1362500.1 unnamed protein product [Cercospora beticola]